MSTAPHRSRHGLAAARQRVQLRGLNAIDRRNSEGRALVSWRSELVSALGGEQSISPQRMTLIDLCVRTRALLDHADAYLLAQPSIVNKRRRAMLPIVAQRQTLCDSLARLLNQLGLKRVPKPVPSLGDYISGQRKEASA